MIESRISKYQKLIIAGLFLVFVIVGFFYSDDYGIAWDEPNQIEIGKLNYDYLTGATDSLASYHDRFYGAAYEMPLYALQMAFNFKDSLSVYNFNHLANHLLFIISLGFFFALLFKIFNHFNGALLGTIMLYIHPRIFAHSFFNSKDMVFMSVFIIGLYTLYLLFEKQNKNRIFLHALASALLIDIRILGIVLPFISLLVAFPNLLNRQLRKQTLQTISLYSILILVFIYLFWPALWTDPLLIGKSFSRMSHFPFRYDILFQGVFIKAYDLPWNYIPTWFLITTPPFILLLTIIGFVWIIRDYFKNPEHAFTHNKTWFTLILASFPIDFIIILILLNSSLYDGWRQVYFLYPLILVSAVFGFISIMNTLKNKLIWKRIIIGFIIIFVLLTIKKLYQLHPYEQVYFNHFVSKKNENRRKSFEMDYWGLSYREGIEYIIKNDSSSSIKIYFANAAGINNIQCLAQKHQKRIIEVAQPEDADYFISNYRFHPQDYKYTNEVFRIERDQNRILSVFKISKP